MQAAISKASVVDVVQRRPCRYRGRAILILALLPLLAATRGLYNAMPPPDLKAQFDGQRPFVYWQSKIQLEEIDRSDPFKTDAEPIYRMNIDTGEITEATKGDLFRHEVIYPRGERILLSYHQSISQTLQGASKGVPNNRCCAHFKNMTTGDIRKVEFDWRHENNEVIANRFVVCRDRNNIYAIDLEEPNPQEFSIAAPLTATGPYFDVKAIYGTDYIFEIHPPVQANSTVHKLDLFKLGEHQIQLVKTIQMGGPGISKFEGQMLTLSTDGKRVEFYSIDDLEFVKAIDISEQFLAKHNIVDLQGTLLLGVDNQTSNGDYYDILSGEQLELPFSGMHPRWWPKDPRYWCFSGGLGNKKKHAYIYDVQEKRVCLAVPYECSSLAFLDDGRFAVVHPAYGVSTEVFDLNTGETTRHAPYQWCAVALAVTLLAWLGWWTTWVIVSAQEGSWIWVDLALIFGVVPGFLTYVGVGNLYPQIGLWSCSTNFAVLNGVFIGLLCAVGVSFALSCSRQSVSIIPVTLVYTTSNLWLSSAAVRPGMIGSAHYLRVSMVVSSCIALVIVAAMLMRGIGFKARKQLPQPTVLQNESSRLRLLDLFIYMACVGVIVAASRPLVNPLPKLSLQFLLDRYWLPTTLAASTLSLAVILTVLNLRLWVAKFGMTLAGVAWCVLVAQAVLIFAGFTQRIIHPNALQTTVVASTSALICALAMRQRNYRICREIRQDPTRN